MRLHSQSHHAVPLKPALWLPQVGEPVRLFLSSGETLPARVLSSDRECVVVAIIVPLQYRDKQGMGSLVLEYLNPGGIVRLHGDNELAGDSAHGFLVRIHRPRLLEISRVHDEVHVKVRRPLVLTDASGLIVFGHTTDVYVDGLAVEDACSLVSGEELRFHLTPDHEVEPIDGRCIVVGVDGAGTTTLRLLHCPRFEEWRYLRFILQCQSEETFRKKVVEHSMAARA